MSACECALQGPPPLLLSSISSDDLSILLSGSDRKSSQVEVRRHLRAPACACARLPWLLILYQHANTPCMLR
jgi:hypothetical protein